MLHIIIIVIMNVAGFSEAIVLCARASIATLPDITWSQRLRVQISVLQILMIAGIVRFQ